MNWWATLALAAVTVPVFLTGLLAWTARSAGPIRHLELRGAPQMVQVGNPAVAERD